MHVTAAAAGGGYNMNVVFCLRSGQAGYKNNAARVIVLVSKR